MRIRRCCLRRLVDPGYWKDCLPQSGRDGFDRRRRINMGYLVVVNGTEKCAILVDPGCQKYMFYSGEHKARLCDVIKMEEESLTRACVFFGQGNVRHVVGEGKGNHRIRYHLHLILKDVDLNYVVVSAC